MKEILSWLLGFAVMRVWGRQVDRAVIKVPVVDGTTGTKSTLEALLSYHPCSLGPSLSSVALHRASHHIHVFKPSISMVALVFAQLVLGMLTLDA